MFDDWLIGKISVSDWLWGSLARPDNFPAYLNALFAMVLAVFAAFAWHDAKDAAGQTQQQLNLLRKQQRPWVYVSLPTIDA